MKGSDRGLYGVITLTSHHIQVQLAEKEGTVFFSFFHSVLFFPFSSLSFFCFQLYFYHFLFPLFETLLKSCDCLVLVSLQIAGFPFFCISVHT